MKNIKDFTDKELYAECKKWGARALEARRKFAGLLPEVYRRRLYEKKGFSYIYEFAAKLAGMSRDQVDIVLRLERRFYDKPVLKDALVTGKVSTNKLARLVSIATKENQSEIIEKAEILSNRALELFVNDYKSKNGLNKTKNDQESLHVQTLELDEDVEKELAELQKKGIDINDMLRNFLSERKEKIEREIKKLSEEQQEKKSKRYIHVKIKKVIKEKYGKKCSETDCNKPSEQLHHENHFAKCQNHDPQFLRPLCKAHHELRHIEDEKVQKYRQSAMRT